VFAYCGPGRNPALYSNERSATCRARSSFERHLGLSLPTHAKAERCDVRHLERLPLGMSYPAVVQHVKDLLARPPLGGHDAIAPATLVLDSTGVGNAVLTSSTPRSCHTCAF